MNDFVDLVTAACFVCVLIVGVMLMVVQNLRRQRPEAVIHERMAAAFLPADGHAAPAGATLAAEPRLFAALGTQSALGRWIDARL
jgi:hypothetical protein